MVDKDTNIAAGTVILSDIDYKNGSAQFHIKISANHRGKGFATDAIRVVERYAFHELRLNCLYSEVLSYNMASRGMLEKCSFKCDGVLRGRLYKNAQKDKDNK